MKREMNFQCRGGFCYDMKWNIRIDGRINMSFLCNENIQIEKPPTAVHQSKGLTITQNADEIFDRQWLMC